MDRPADPVALGYLVFLQVTGGLTFGHLGWAHTLLLVASGLVTVVRCCSSPRQRPAAAEHPRAAAVHRAHPEFLLGVLYFGETMSVGRWIGFALVWLALVILTVYGVRQARRARRPAAEPVAEPV